MQLTTALAAALTAQKSCCYSWRQGKWKPLATYTGFSTVRCEYEWAGKTRKAGLLNLGRVDIKICSLAWVEEAQHGTVADEPLSRAASMFLRVRDKPSARLGACPPAFDPKLPEWPIS